MNPHNNLGKATIPYHTSYGHASWIKIYSLPCLDTIQRAPLAPSMSHQFLAVIDPLGLIGDEASRVMDAVASVVASADESVPYPVPVEPGISITISDEATLNTSTGVPDAIELSSVLYTVSD